MNPVPHLLVADAVHRGLGWPVRARSHAAAGAVAPDCYRLLVGVGYRALHFRSRRQAGQRKRDFITTYLTPALIAGGEDDQAFWTGWYSHIIADQVWRRMLRTELRGLWVAVAGEVGDERDRLRDEYQAACDRIDRQLAAVPGSQVGELRWLLRSWEPRPDLGPLSGPDLKDWVTRVASTYMPPDEPSLAGSEGLDYGFVVRAMEASQHQTLTEMARLIAEAESEPDFEEFFEEV